MSQAASIAQAVVSHLELSNITFDSEFVNFQRSWLPDVSVEDLAELKVFVTPRTQTTTMMTRRSLSDILQIDILIQKKLEQGASESEALNELDNLVDLVETIRNYVSGQDYLGTFFKSVSVEPLVAQEHLESMRVFTSVVTLTLQDQQPF